jgi:REP element-mobilizing transposase RayT
MKMGLYKNKFKIESTRLKDWDYSTPSWYYVTICTKNMKQWFGEIKNNEMILNDIGKIVDTCWRETPIHYKNIDLDYFVIMPNHVHGIVILNTMETRINTMETRINTVETGIDAVETGIDAVETGHAPSLQSRSHILGNLIGSFKAAVSKWAHQNKFIDFQWQPRFYDHIIRNEKDLHRIRTYIKNNPLKWELDKYYKM